MNTLTEAISYFAKYPPKAVVLENFKRPDEKIPGYDALKAQITAIPAHIFTDIDEFIVSSDEKEVATRLRSGSGMFMLVEYGPISGTPHNAAGVRDIMWNLGIIIGYKRNMPNTNIIEEALLMDTCLDRLKTIASQMQADSEEGCGAEEMADSNIYIAPIEPGLLYGCLGWELTFRNSMNTAF